jgi:hypothetical protein
MEEENKRGKTLWEMLVARVHGSSNGNGAATSFANPLDVRIGTPVPIPFANGPDLADYDFSVQEICEYVRRIAGQEFSFTDYVLRGLNRKTLDADQVMRIKLRVLPNQAGGRDTLLLRLYDEFGFAEDFLSVLKDSTGRFEAREEGADACDTFERVNDLRDSYEAAVLVVSETTPDGKAPPGKASASSVEYWDYWREMEIVAGNTAKEFLFVEMNSQTGWFQLWRGREFFS